MSSREHFDTVSAHLLESDPEVERGRMFNAEGLKAGGKFFAFVVEGDLVVKVPEARVGELIEAGEGRPFGPGDRTMREWVRLSPPDVAACEAYVAEARSYNRELTGV